MSRFISLTSAIVLSLAAAPAWAAPATKPTPRWKGYGFLPGYHQPLNNSLPLYKQKNANLRMARQERRPWYIYPTPQYYNFYDGELHYPGRPGFFRGQYNGGSFGPCYTRTPVGLVWNCG